MTWEPTDSASKQFFATEAAFRAILLLFNLLAEFQRAAQLPHHREPATLRTQVLTCGAILGAPDGGWLFICHKAGVVCKPETLCSTTSSLGNSQFRRSWIPLSPPDLNHQLKSLPIESNFGIQAYVPLQSLLRS
jgi:hypothetical protein